jgi:hypothetical protein
MNQIFLLFNNLFAKGCAKTYTKIYIEIFGSTFWQNVGLGWVGFAILFPKGWVCFAILFPKVYIT